jgi:predicted metalloprotease with PDZ domain
MKLHYKLTIENPSTHQVLVEIRGKRPAGKNQICFFLPRWSPGSYLIREYSRHLSHLQGNDEIGRSLYFSQVGISTFVLDYHLTSLLRDKNTSDEFVIKYSVFCHELTVRTSHVNNSHAFLHLPTILMGIQGETIENPEIEIRFPASWSKLTTGLKDISKKREMFLYSAKNYDELIDSPIEIGCHETDGFSSFGIDHDLAFYGKELPHKESIKKDIQKIVEHIGNFFGGVPYDKYTFITHLVPGLYGGLEHLNSTALQFCPTQLTQRKGYLNYLCLVSHEYFHLWNVKRIRPKELGPFDYLNEATTNLLWLAEGLTSLMDELFVYRAGLMSLEEYLELQKDNINRYLLTPGKKFHSLNNSSFNAWIKLYRPDENLNNSSVSYYLKGGIVFWALHLMLVQEGKSIDNFLRALWARYQKNPQSGMTEDEVYELFKSIGGEKILSSFKEMTTTTKDIDLETLVKTAGMKFEWENSEAPYLGLELEYSGDRVIVKAVTLDGPAYKGGINAGDEILAINGMRVLKDRFADYPKYLRVNESYEFLVSRLSMMNTLQVNVGIAPVKLKALTVVDRVKCEKVFKVP